MQDCIPVEKHIALYHVCLSSGNSLMSCGEPFGILDSTTFIIVREFCHAVKVHLMPLVILKLTSSKIAKLVLILRVCIEFFLYLVQLMEAIYPSLLQN
jgi:hypothetical protein